MVEDFLEFFLRVVKLKENCIYNKRVFLVL